MKSPFTSREMQRLLGVEPDGVFGPETRKAMRRALGNPKDATNRNWSDKRLIIGVQQVILSQFERYNGVIDGLVGPETLDAMERYQNHSKESGLPEMTSADFGILETWNQFRDWFFSDPKSRIEIDPVYAQVIKIEKSKSTKLRPNDWPKQRDIGAFYGRRGENQKRIKLPYKMTLDWDQTKTVKTILCHKEVATSLLRIFRAVAQEYTTDEIKRLGLDQYGGCLNVRRVRGGRSWSTHSWGVAVDINPNRNALRWNHEKARLAKPDAKKFWEIVEAESWVSLGRERDFDWMHFQAARL